MRITTEEELATYLKSKSISYSRITALSGGNANFVFAVEDHNGQTTVIKHAETYLKAVPTWELGTVRMDCEARALKLLPSVMADQGQLLKGKHAVKIPGIFSYDAEAHVIHETYAGSRTLKAAYIEDDEVDVQLCGKELAYWLANLHASTKTLDMGDVSWARDIYRHIYRGLGGVLEEYGLDGELGTRINERYGSLLATEDQNVLHGDFWPGNMILSEDGKILTVGDWEMVRRGTGATDVGQFSAEAHLLDRFKGGKGMLNAFLGAYREQVKFDQEFAARVAVHAATHLIYWPRRVHWVERSQVRKLAEDAVEILLMVEKGDWTGLKQSFLGELFADVES